MATLGRLVHTGHPLTRLSTPDAMILASRSLCSLLHRHSAHTAPHRKATFLQRQWASSSSNSTTASSSSTTTATNNSNTSSISPSRKEAAGGNYNLYGDEWENTVDHTIQSFDDLPHRLFGVNQHMVINYELKEALRMMLRNFNAPIVYCFAYGSGVFPQEHKSRSITEAEFRAVHPRPPEALVKSQKGSPKMIDFIFGVSHIQHWHSMNIKQHRDHYSSIASLGSGFVSRVQNWGAGVYFHPYVELNGTLVKYGVTSIENLVHDLSTWDSLYLAGRLQKPVKILRDHPQVRVANQHNLIAALRTALLMLPPSFTEAELYSTIAGLSYLGDPRMSLPTENSSKVNNIVSHNMIHFRRLYAPLIKTLPNVVFDEETRLDDESWLLNPEANKHLHQDMDPLRRGNMVRRLPKNFRSRLYFQYQKKFSLPREEFTAMIERSSDEDINGVKRRLASEFDKHIAKDDPNELTQIIRRVIKQTVNWPSTTQSLKGILTGGLRRTIRYVSEKIGKWNSGRKQKIESVEEEKKKKKKKKQQHQKTTKTNKTEEEKSKENSSEKGGKNE